MKCPICGKAMRMGGIVADGAFSFPGILWNSLKKLVSKASGTRAVKRSAFST